MCRIFEKVSACVYAQGSACVCARAFVRVRVCACVCARACVLICMLSTCVTEVVINDSCTEIEKKET